MIERPASVVKELLENSLDAGASSIRVDCWGAGQSHLRISDDGEGMTPEDAQLALDRHATSKLKSLEDLHALDTFGFRGEALPSIAAISRFELSTRPRGAEQGWTISLEGGKALSAKACGMPQGTTIDIQDLFFNTPARLKFLKRDATERSHILRTVQDLALVNPSVRIELAMEGRDVLTLSPTTLRGRLEDLWGRTVTETLDEIDVTLGPCRVHGLVSRGAVGHHATKACQIFFVNQRPIQARALLHAVYEAQKDNLPVGRHPVFALMIDIDPKLVDVNVHPAKREVRFSNERALYDLLYQATRGHKKSVGAQEAPWGGRTIGEPRPAISPMAHPHVSFQEELAVQVTDAPTATLELLSRRFLGQFQNLYLLIQDSETLLIIDQHAAAERVLYERLLRQASDSSSPRQSFLAPFMWEVTSAQAERIAAALEPLNRMGFGLEPFGPTTFALKEWPAALPLVRQAKRFLEDLLEAFDDTAPRHGTRFEHEIAARAACRSAIMAGDTLQAPEALQLLDDLRRCEKPDTCPHGRPTFWRMSSDDLNRRFRRPTPA